MQFLERVLCISQNIFLKSFPHTDVHVGWTWVTISKSKEQCKNSWRSFFRKATWKLTLIGNVYGMYKYNCTRGPRNLSIFGKYMLDCPLILFSKKKYTTQLLVAFYFIQKESVAPFFCFSSYKEKVEEGFPALTSIKVL